MDKIDNTKLISVGAFIVATIVLIIVAMRDSSALSEIYFFYCFAFAGLTVSKGIVTTFQKRNALLHPNLKEQTYERNDDIERDFDSVIKRPSSEVETQTNGPETRRSNS